MEEKKLKRIIYEIKGIKEKNWHTIGRTVLQYSNQKSIEKIFTFEKFYEAIQNKSFNFYCVRTSKTFFKKRPMVVIYDFLTNYYLTKEKMGDYVYYREREVDESNLPITDIMESLPQNEFFEFLKDNNLQQCPFLKK